MTSTSVEKGILGGEKSDGNIVLRVENLSKTYGAVRALRQIDFTLYQGEVQALVGENGAGKSTLAKILSGAVQPDPGGRIWVRDKEVKFDNPREARRTGIAEVYQEPMVIRHLPIWMNVFLGEELTKGGLLDIRSMINQSENLLQTLGYDLDPTERVGLLGQAAKQIVAIAKALHGDVKVLILDEPTASLTASETERLFEIMNRLKARGVGIIYISHRLREITEIADRVTVRRDGAYVATEDARKIDEDRLIHLMTGKQIEWVKTIVPEVKDEEVVLETRGLSSAPSFNDVTLKVCRGEILGIGGLVGSGKEELSRAIFGLVRSDSGQVVVEGEPLKPTPQGMLQRGVMYFPPDRHKMGLIMNQNVIQNLTLPSLPFYLTQLHFLFKSKMSSVSEDVIDRLDIRPPEPHRELSTFSGGNQQKVMLGRALTRPVKLIIFDEPTHGVDVGARARIYKFIREMAEQGLAVLIVTSDLQELLTLPTNVGVMSWGVLSEIMTIDEATAERVLGLSFSGHRLANNGCPLDTS